MEWEQFLSQVRYRILHMHTLTNQLIWCEMNTVWWLPGIQLQYSPFSPLLLFSPLSSYLILFTFFPLLGWDVNFSSPLWTHPFFIHSLCFISLSLWSSFPTSLAEDLVTSTPPKPTKARRFLLPFVFCSDSPLNGMLRSHWTVGRGAYPQNCVVVE